MRVAIHSIQKTLYEGVAEKLICGTPQGQITVLNDHIPLITKIMGPAVITEDPDGRRHEVALPGGILEVRPESEVVILADS
ncbi:MAG: F0F1 ATP synthase subunit epsilon [Patescibacteria group bacterium]|mgnify:FL=1